MTPETTLLETARLSKSKSLRMSLPKRIASKMDVGPEDIIGFYSNSDGEIIIKKLK